MELREYHYPSEPALLLFDAVERTVSVLLPRTTLTLPTLPVSWKEDSNCNEHYLLYMKCDVYLELEAPHFRNKRSGSFRTLLNGAGSNA